MHNTGGSEWRQSVFQSPGVRYFTTGELEGQGQHTVKIWEKAKTNPSSRIKAILFGFFSWQCTSCKHFWSLGIFLTPYLLKEMGKQIKVILKTKNICCQKNLCHWSHYLALGRVPELRLETVLQIGWAFIHIFPSYLLISFVFVFVFVSVFCICVIGNRFANWPSGRIYADNPHFWFLSLFDRPPLTYWLYNRTSIAPPFSPRSLHHNHPSSSSVAIV